MVNFCKILHCVCILVGGENMVGGPTAGHSNGQQNEQQRVAGSSSSYLRSASSKPDMTSHVRCDESPSVGVMTAREYAKSVECWLWQQQCWMQQVNWATWINYSMPFLAAATTVGTPAPVSASVNGNTRQDTAPPQFHQQQLTGNFVLG